MITQARTWKFPHQFSFVLMIVFFFASCSSDSDVEPTSSDNTGANTSGETVEIGEASTTSGLVQGNTDAAYDEDDLPENSTFSSVVTIVFGNTISITNPLAASGVTITQSNGDVVVNSTVSEVEYVVSGTSSNGSLKFYSEKKFKLTLNGITLTNTDGPAIDIQSGKRVFVALNENTTNVLTDGSTYPTSEEDKKATFFSEGQLIFTGTGSLSLKGNYKHALCSDDYVRILSGNITVTAAASDGIHTNNAFIADGGTITISAAGDGIQVEEGYVVINDGTFKITSVDKGIAASWDTDNTIDPYLTINGGTINVTSSAGEGIESKSVMTINGGSVTATTRDDGLNAGDALYINGGVIYAYASNNDGIDSNGKLTVTGGTVISVGAGSPEEGFDCDRNTFTITGGILVGTGGATSSPTASVTTQPAVILGSGTANQIFHIESADGEEVLTFLVPRNYSTMLFSSPKLKTSTSYKTFTGGSVAEGESVNGLYTTGTYTLGSSSTSFSTRNTTVTKVGGSIGPG